MGKTMGELGFIDAVDHHEPWNFEWAAITRGKPLIRGESVCESGRRDQRDGIG
jgi:hypothetical protein